MVLPAGFPIFPSTTTIPNYRSMGVEPLRLNPHFPTVADVAGGQTGQTSFDSSTGLQIHDGMTFDHSPGTNEDVSSSVPTEPDTKVPDSSPALEEDLLLPNILGDDAMQEHEFDELIQHLLTTTSSCGTGTLPEAPDSEEQLVLRLPSPGGYQEV